MKSSVLGKDFKGESEWVYVQLLYKNIYGYYFFVQKDLFVFYVQIKVLGLGF